jgi:septum formation protein
MGNSKLQFILASASPRRKELIGHLKIPFEILTLNVPEESHATDPVEYCREISEVKGRAVFDKLIRERAESSFYVVSADTIVTLNGKIFGKPKDKNEAREFLSELAGKTHSVFTAVAVIFHHQNRTEKFSFAEESRVTFSPISEELMERYLETGDSLDKAGAYGIQGPSLTFISRVEGDYANVVGFPLSRFVSRSAEFLGQKFPETPWLDLF